MRRLAVAATSLAALLMLPASAAADCNGPDCGGLQPPVEGVTLLVTIAILLAFVTVMAAAEVRRR